MRVAVDKLVHDAALPPLLSIKDAVRAEEEEEAEQDEEEEEEQAAEKQGALGRRARV